jgi:hypothetical protein
VSGLGPEIRRRGGKREALHALLSDGRWHSQQELVAVGGLRYGARLLELRQGGACIETDDLGGGAFRYRMLVADVHGQVGFGFAGVG